MPTAEVVKSSWADEVENEANSDILPPPSEVVEGGIKTVTEYKFNEDNKKVKIVRTFKIERKIVSKTIAMRKTWKKFGSSAGDKPGPNPATTVVAEDCFMQFLSNRGEEEKLDEDALEKIKAMGDKSLVKCRTCGGDHWTTKCPYKDSIPPKPEEKKPTPPLPSASPALDEKSKATGTTKYIPPNLREGANKRGDSMNNPRGRDDTSAIRISNLSENTTDADLEDLVRPLGPFSKIYLAKDKATNRCKGFAYIHFKNKADAAKAIPFLDGYGYDHLILSVDWSKPTAQNKADHSAN